MLALDYFQKIGRSNVIESFFYLLFYATFNLILTMFFMVIILSSHSLLLKKIHLTTIAMSRIASKESRITTKKWINLFCMSPPIEFEAYESLGIKLSDSEKCHFKLFLKS